MDLHLPKKTAIGISPYDRHRLNPSNAPKKGSYKFLQEFPHMRFDHSRGLSRLHMVPRERRKECTL